MAAKKKPPTQPININTASPSQLQMVPGIGPVTADKIIQMRKSYGTFKSVDDLTAIRGIGPKKMEKMRKYLTVARPPTTTHPAKCATCANQGPRAPAKPVAPQKPAPQRPPVKVPAAQSAAEVEEP